MTPRGCPRRSSAECPSVARRRRLARRRRQRPVARLLRQREDHAGRRSSAPPRTSSAVNFVKLELGRLFTPGRGRAPPAGRGARPEPRTSRCSRTSIRSARRSASARNEFTVIGVLGKRPEPGRVRAAPTTSWSSRTPRTRSSTARSSKARLHRRQRQPAAVRSAMIAIVPREDAHARAGDARGRSGDAHPPQPEARRAERLRPGHPGRDAEGLGSDQPGDVPRAGRHLARSR